MKLRELASDPVSILEGISASQDRVVLSTTSWKETSSKDTIGTSFKRIPLQDVDEAFVKKVLKAGDEEAMINTSHPDWKKFAEEHPKDAANLKKSLATQIANGNLELKKLYKPYVKFIKNFVELKDAYATLDQVLGKRVLVVDDILSSGTTMLEMFRQLKEFEPEMVAGLTIFKRTTETVH